MAGLTGRCLCGGVRYRIEGALQAIVHCHCSMCRKAHGAAFRTRAALRRSDFTWTAGEELVTGYRSSANTTRTFCRVCRSNLISVFDDDPETIALALGTLDDDPGARPVAHVFVGSKAPWYEVADDLPQFDTVPPERGR